MSGIFMSLKQMDGIRFSHDLLEPVIQTSLPKIEGETIDLNTKTVANVIIFLSFFALLITLFLTIQLGQRAFSRVPRSDLYGSSITVSIGDNVDTKPEAKPEIPWLQQSQHIELSTTTGEDDEQGRARGHGQKF